jgi:hypothetical protein
LLRSSRNLILEQRTRVARDWNDFLHFSPRRIEPALMVLEGEEVENQFSEFPFARQAVFDQDAITAFNNALPLSLWIDAAGNPALPANMQIRVALAGWVRALLLGRMDDARTLMRRVIALQPEAAASARAFVEAADPDTARRAAVYLVLREPSLGPKLLSSEAPTPNLAAAHYVDNAGYNHRTGCWDAGLDRSHAHSLEFLTKEQRAAAEAEGSAIRSAGPWGATFLLRSTLEWAAAQAGDPRIPEALHRAIMAAKFRCTDAGTRKYSKQAFELLHRNYPGSAWTTKTKYWY